MSMTHMHVMWLLQHHGDLSMSRLAELLDVSLSNATGIVDRMEERGLVERVRVPDDRRVVLVRDRSARASDARTRSRRSSRTGCGRSSASSTPAQLDRRRCGASTTSAAPSSPSSVHDSPRRPRHHTQHRAHRRKEQSTDGIHPRRAGRLRRRPSRTIPPSDCRTGRRWRSCSRSCSGCSWAPSTRRSSVRRCPTIVTELARQRHLRLGRHDLPADQHDQRPVLGQAVRPLRPQADVHDRHRHLPRRLGPVRPVART